jgi:hypothetical protein
MDNTVADRKIARSMGASPIELKVSRTVHSDDWAVNMNHRKSPDMASEAADTAPQR